MLADDLAPDGISATNSTDLQGSLPDISASENFVRPCRPMAESSPTGPGGPERKEFRSVNARCGDHGFFRSTVTETAQRQNP